MDQYKRHHNNKAFENLLKSKFKICFFLITKCFNSNKIKKYSYISIYIYAK